MDASIWEKTLIGTVLHDPQTMAECEDLLPSDFTGIHKILWAEMLNLYRRNGLDARSLIAAIASSPDYERVTSDVGNIDSYVAELMLNRGTQVGEYSNQVLGASIKRHLKNMAALIAAQAQDDTKTAEELIEFTEQKLANIRRNRIADGITMADLFSVYLPHLEGLRNGTIKPAWTPSLTAMKNIIDYAEDSDLITIAARPGQGKSSYLRYEAYKHARAGGSPIIFNLENSEMEYAKNFLALHLGIDGKKLKNPKLLSEQELDRVKYGAEELSRMNLRIISLGSPSVQQIVSIARRKIAEKKADLLLIDYVQLIQNGNENKVQDVTVSTTTLRGLALSLNVPIIIASQLSRNIEHRGNGSDPELSDLRDSGSLEQDSTIVAFIKNAWTDPTPEQIRVFPENENIVDPLNCRAVPVRFYVKKNRNSATGISDLVKWNKSTGLYQTLERGTRI